MNLLNLKRLSDAVNLKIGTRTLRDVAPEIGISFSTLNRVSNGKEPDLNSYIAICKWLGLELNTFLANREQRQIEVPTMPLLPIGTIILAQYVNPNGNTGTISYITKEPESAAKAYNIMIAESNKSNGRLTKYEYITPPKL